MVRLSALRNRPVICEGKPLGLLQSVSLDDDQRGVEALIVSCGFRGKHVVLGRDVLSVADGFILAGRAIKYKRSLERPLCRFARDTTGLLAGRVTDFAIDEGALRVAAVQLAPGYLPGERGRRMWLYVYARGDAGTGEITVPALLDRGTILCREENGF